MVLSKMAAPSCKILALDLDGTLLRTDSLWELFLCALGQGHINALMSLLDGRPAFKKKMAESYTLDFSSLPWNTSVIDLAKSWHSNGGEVWLVTAADKCIAQQVVDYFGFFSGVIASDGVRNLKGEEKAQSLVALFGEQGFAYAGDARCDLKVWAHAAEAYVISDSFWLSDNAEKVCPSVHRLAKKHDNTNKVNIFTALRPYQWVKNILLFAAIFLAHQFSISSFAKAGLGFIIFSLAASAGYIINDLLDLASDRIHPEKYKRPFASGAISLQTGMCTAVGLFSAAFFLSACIGKYFFLCTVIYATLTLLYSFLLKRLLMLDVVVLSFLYTLRVFAGGIALPVHVSQWVLAFSFFIFLMLSLAKRIVELRRMECENMSPNERRPYVFSDMTVLCSLAGGSICCAAFTLVLYVGDEQAYLYYTQPEWLLLFVPVMVFWLSRLLVFAERGIMTYDPIYFILRDKLSLICVGFGVVSYVLASLGL